MTSGCPHGTRDPACSVCDTRTHQGIRRDTETQAWNLFNLFPPFSLTPPVSTLSPPRLPLPVGSDPVPHRPGGLLLQASRPCSRGSARTPSLPPPAFSTGSASPAQTDRGLLHEASPVTSPTSRPLAFCLYIFVFLFRSLFLSWLTVIYLFILLASPHGMRDLSSLTRD